MKNLLYVIFVTAFLGISISAQTPNTINYQGFLKDSGGNIVADGDYEMTFRLYSEVTGVLSSKVYESTVTVPVRNGIFNVSLGESPTFSSQGADFSRQYWLGITIAGGDEMPLVKLNASPYALRSLTTSSVNGPVITPENLTPALRNSLLPVGTVISSVLSPEVFSREMSVDGVIYWVLADGTSYPESAYARITGTAEVPDISNDLIRTEGGSPELYYYIKIN